ncbi:MAG TPA: RDD family protein [Candidatus Bathyarchaeia archaeon]|nr:RDD family protein [Candidatus Bathyarchaeia archaeon]
MGALSATYGASIFFRRWAATVIDFILLIFFTGAIVYVDDRFGEQIANPFIACLFVGVICYYLLLEGFTGYTLGKFALRIRAVNQIGRPPGFVKALLRTFLRIIDTNPFLLGGVPAGICVLASRKKQRLGDMAAKTYVVKIKDLDPAVRGNQGLLIGIFSVLAALSLVSAILCVSSLFTNISKPETFLSHDQQFQVTAPSSWRNDSSLNEEADISISNDFGVKYFMVLSEKKDDFDSGVTLQDYLQIVEGNYEVEMEERPLQLPQETSVNGYPAIDFSFEQEVEDGVEVAYMVTVVDTGTHFHQLHAWTLASKYDGVKEELQGIIQSFQKVKQ